MENSQGIHRFAGSYHIAFVGPEIDHSVVLDHEGNIDQLLQLGIHVLLDLGQQAGAVVGYFLLVAVKKKGIEERKKEDDRQKNHERIGKNITIEGDTFAFHLPGRLCVLLNLFRIHSDEGIIPFRCLRGQWRGRERDDRLAKLTIQKMYIDLCKQGRFQEMNIFSKSED